MKSSAMARLILIAAVVMLYSVSLGHNFLFDEENVILRNPYLKSLSNIPHLFQTGFFYLGGNGAAPFLEYYRPLSVLTFMLDHHFWKADPFGYNLSSLLFHVLLAWTFFEFLLLTIKNIPAALLGALLYSLHPIHTEAINHVSCRSETLGALFLLLSLILYLRNNLWPALICQLLGMLTKESAVLIPLFVIAADLVFVNRMERVRIKKIVSFILLSAAYIIFRKYLCPVPMHLEPEVLSEKALRVLSMAPAFAQYFKTLFWPPYFQLFGSVAFAKNYLSGQVFWTALFYGAVAWALWDARKRRSLAFMGLVFMLGGFMPYLQLVHFYPEWAEHFLTVPALGFAFLWALAMSALFTLKDRRSKMVLISLFCMWIVFLSYRTFQRNVLYNDLEKYYAVLSGSSSPYAVHGMHEQAKIKIAAGDMDGAKKILSEALKKDLNQDVTHALLGWCEANQNNWQVALVHFERSLELNPQVPSYHRDRANALMQLRRYSEAANAYAGILIRAPLDHTTYRAAIAALELNGEGARAMELGQAGLKVMGSKKFESATLMVSLVRLSYRQGWPDQTEAYLKELVEKYSHVPWQGKVADLLSGKLSAEEFKQKVLPQFAGFEEEADTLILMSYVLQGQKESVSTFLDKKKDLFEKKAAKDPLFAKEWQIAKDHISKF